MGRHVHQSSRRSMERHSALHSTAPCAGLRCPGPTHAFDLSACLPAGSPPAGDIAGMWLLGAGSSSSSPSCGATPTVAALFSMARSTDLNWPRSFSCSLEAGVCASAGSRRMKVRQHMPEEILQLTNRSTFPSKRPDKGSINSWLRNSRASAARASSSSWTRATFS